MGDLNTKASWDFKVWTTVGVNLHVTEFLIQGTIVYRKDYVLTDMGMSQYFVYVIDSGLSKLAFNLHVDFCRGFGM